MKKKKKRKELEKIKILRAGMLSMLSSGETMYETRRRGGGGGGGGGKRPWAKCQNIFKTSHVETSEKACDLDYP